MTIEEELAAAQAGEQEPVVGGPGETEKPAGEEPSPQSAGPRLVQVGNYSVPEDEIESLLEFQSWARANSDKMEAFGQYLRGEAQFVVPEAEKKPEPQIDWSLVDPNIRSAYDAQSKQIEELTSRFEELQQPLSAIQEEQQQRYRSEAQQALDAATGTIMDRFKLNDDEIDQLAGDAAKLNIVPSLRAQGMTAQAALETALETAFWRDEKWRQRVLDEEVAARDANGRRSRASQVGGTSGGSDNGLDSQPRTEAERRTAMAAEIAEALRGTP